MTPTRPSRAVGSATIWWANASIRGAWATCTGRAIPGLDVTSPSRFCSRAFADDPDRLARFEREARILAALDHPHIGTIYGVEESDGTRALVLALVDGETLAERLVRGAIPMVEALEYARQIAGRPRSGAR